MFGFGASKKVKTVAETAGEFCVMCDSLARTMAGKDMLDRDDGAVLLLGFNCGAVFEFGENAGLDGPTTKEALQLLFDRTQPTSEAQKTMALVTALRDDAAFLQAIAAGQDAVRRWQASSGDPLPAARRYGDLVDKGK